MSIGYQWEPAPPKLPRGSVAKVVEALLPIHIWRAPITKVVSQGLSLIERFVIEAALGLGDITATDLAEVAGLPPDLAARVTARVAAVGVLEPVPASSAAAGAAAGTVYRPVPAAAAEALSRAELREYHPADLTFMYLPRTDELLAIETGPGRPEPSLIHCISPAYQAPLPADVIGSDPADFLNARIAAGTVLGLPDWVYAAETDGSRMPETCPAYRCRGHLKGAGKGPVLELVDAAKPDRTQPCRFTAVAEGLSGWLNSLAESLDGAFARWDEPSPRPQRLSPEDAVGWAFGLPGELSRKVMHSDLPLTRPLGLSVRDEEAMLQVSVRLVPADDEARAAFAVDRAVGVVVAVPLKRLEPAVLTAAIAAAGTDYGCEPTVDEIRAELWRRRQFFRVYALRAADDFAYD